MAKLLMVVKKWCIENGEFSRDTWYKLMIVSLGKNTKNFLMKSYLRYVAVIHYGVWLLF